MKRKVYLETHSRCRDSEIDLSTHSALFDSLPVVVYIQEKLTNSEIIDESQIPEGKAYLGATVKLQDKDNGNEIQYTLVSVDEADFDENKISTESPIGKALLGKEPGAVVEIQVPVGTLTYEIRDISRG